MRKVISDVADKGCQFKIFEGAIVVESEDYF